MKEAQLLFHKNNPDARKEMSIRTKQYYIDHPERREEQSKNNVVYRPGVKEKISKANFGKKRSDETKKLMSSIVRDRLSTPEAREESIKYLKNYWKIPESREKQSICQTQRWSSVDARKEQSIRLKRYFNEHPEAIDRLKENLNSYYKTHENNMKNPDVAKKTSDSLKKLWEDPDYRNSRTGLNHSNWKGGISYEPYCPKFNEEFKNRVRAYFDYTCIICGKSNENGRRLSVHHVEYNKQACCDGEPVHFAALCCKCHSKTNYERVRWETILHIIIYEIYNNRSYYTKEEWKLLDIPSNNSCQ